VGRHHEATSGFVARKSTPGTLVTTVKHQESRSTVALQAVLLWSPDRGTPKLRNTNASVPPEDDDPDSGRDTVAGCSLILCALNQKNSERLFQGYPPLTIENNGFILLTSPIVLCNPLVWLDIMPMLHLYFTFPSLNHGMCYFKIHKFLGNGNRSLWYLQLQAICP